MQVSQRSSYPWWLVAMASTICCCLSVIRERGCRVQVLAHKENPQKMLFTRDRKAVAMKVGIRLEECVTTHVPVLVHRECTRRPVIPHHHDPASACNKTRAAKPGENGLKWSTMGENGRQFKCATSSMHKKHKKTCCGTTNLLNRAKTGVQVVAGIPNFALCAHYVNGIPSFDRCT